jgi:histidine ammonia-lyase
MGMTAANKLLRVVENTRNVLALESLAVAQALDYRAPLKPGKRGQRAHATIRAVSPMISQDRILTDDFRRVAELIASAKLADVLR